MEEKKGVGWKLSAEQILELINHNLQMIAGKCEKNPFKCRVIKSALQIQKFCFYTHTHTPGACPLQTKAF